MQSGLPTVDDLVDLPPAVALSLVVSMDGQLVGSDGSSRTISGPEDLDWLRRLRASSDAVVVGAATAEAERYQPLRVREEFAAARMRAGLQTNPELVILHSRDDFAAVLRGLGPRVLLEAGVRLHAVLADYIERVWISHSPAIVGDRDAAFALPLHGFSLVERCVGETFVVSRFERVSQH